MATNPNAPADPTKNQNANWIPVIKTTNGIDQAMLLPGTNIPAGSGYKHGNK